MTLAFASATVALLPTHADTFGTGINQFTIDFVNIGNAGNANDAGAGGGSFSSPYGGVSYRYRMGVYEISQAQITMATGSGLTGVTAGAWGANQPAGFLTWFEAAGFVNWLNTSTGHQAAYQLDAGLTTLTLWSSALAWQTDGENLYRHKDAYYFLPNEDEWYKAAFHKNDGVTANYWDYATGSNTLPADVTSGTTPFTAVYDGATPGVPSAPANVNQAGGLGAYGIMGMNGNVHEWLESALDGTNNFSAEPRSMRGGYYGGGAAALDPTFRLTRPPLTSSGSDGFRVASIPEPSTALLLGGTGLGLLLRRRRS